MAKFSSKDDVKNMIDTASRKNGYGINQVKTQFSYKNTLMRDDKAVRGKQILREKIYTKQ